jgi:hypothetical protein
LRARSRRRTPWRRILELEKLEDRTVPSGSSLHPAGAGPAGAATPWSNALSPAAIKQAYGINLLPSADDGTGQTIAIVVAYDNPKLVNAADPTFVNSDLHKFDLQYGLPEPAGFFSKVGQTGGAPPTTLDPAGVGNNNWEGEAALAVEWAHALAPGAHILLVESNDATTTLFTAANWAGTLSGAQVVSLGGGESEFSFEKIYDSNYFVQPGGYGVTYLAASGDGGAPGTYPAYSPQVVAVGGTTLNLDSSGNYNFESGWSNSGGGVSQFEPQPTYQAGVNPGLTLRTIPDVSFDADSTSPVSVYDSYNGGSTPWWQYSGTSVSCPCWAALIGIADQLRAGLGLTSLSGPGQLLPMLYNLPAGDFHDITSGSNGTNNGAPAGPGYDQVTGLGTPVANKLVPDLAALRVDASTPASGGVVASAPTMFTITFADPINPTSLHANALAVNGIAATGVSLDSTHTIATFTFSSAPVAFQGPQSITVAAGAVTAASSGTRTNALFSGTFYYDPLPLAIVATSPTPGGSFSVPASSFTYDVTFNQPIDPKFVKTSNLVLFPAVGTVTAAITMPGNQTVAYTIKGLSTVGPFTISIAKGTFKDQYDDPVSPPDFSATYYAEQNNVTLPTPLASTAPLGSQVYSTTASDQLIYPGDSDRFLLSADPGQTIAVVVTPAPASGLTPTVQISDPSGAVLGSTAASGQGLNALLQAVPTTTSGTYTVTVGGAAGTMGNYTLLVYLNAAVESASQGFGSDTNPSTAQNLNPSFATLQTSLTSASRAAVIGSVGQPVTVNANAFGYWDSTGAHTAGVLSYEVGQSPTSSNLYNDYFIFNLSGTYPTILGASLNLSADNYSSPLSSDTYGLFDVSTPLASLVATGVGQTNIYNDLGSGVSYGTKTVTASSNGQLLSIPLNAAAVAALNNKRGSQFALGGALTTATGSGAQYLFAGSGTATDTLQLSLTLLDTRYYSFTLGNHELASVGLKYLTGSGETISILDSTGKTLATGLASGSFDQVINNFVAPAAGTYYVVVTGSSTATYNLVVIRDAAWDGKLNSSFSTAQDLTSTTGAVGDLVSYPAPDWYKVTLASGPAQNSLQLETRVPLGGPSQAINKLNPSIMLFNASGTMIATGSVLADGRNQALLATNLTPGATYYIEVTSANGATGEYFLGVTPLAAPAVTSSPANQSVFVGQPATFIAAASGSPAPTVQWQVSTNGGTTYTPIAGATSVTYTIAATMLSQNGSLYEAVFTNAAGTVTTAPATLTVQPVPVFTKYLVTPLISSSTITAGNSFAVQVQAADQFGNPMTSGYTGPSSVTISLIPPSTASGFPFTMTVNSNGSGWAVVSLVQVGTYTITATGGSFTGSSFAITVTPAAAAKLSFGTPPVTTATGVTLPAVTVQVQDQFGNLITTDNTDKVNLGVAIGPGGFKSGSTTSAIVVGGVATFTNLTLVTPGTYQLSEFVTGFYTGPTSTPFSITPLQVVAGSFASSPSGFSLQFNAPFLINSTTPVLYGQGFGSAAPVPSVTLTQTRDAIGNPANNAVVGSLVVKAANNSITFVATDTTLEGNGSSPVLADGTYTVAIHSSAVGDGFQALNSGGGFLDGKGTGVAGSGDYTTSFTINAAAVKDDVVWVPAVAQGPGQPLSAPGSEQLGGGYPVYLNDSKGTVTRVQVTLNYDPTLLTVSGVTGAGFSLLGTSTPGQAVLQYSGPALHTGTQMPLGFITASVPPGTTVNPTPYKAKDLLTLTGLSINGGAIPAVMANALHLVAYVGDADGNGAYSSNDAVLITRAALQTDTGFIAYPLIDPTVVADTDGVGFIPADAALQANEAGVGFPTANLATPPIPAGVHFQPISNNVDPEISIPASMQIAQDGTLTVPVNIDDARPEGSTGLIEGHLALTYDPRLLSVSPADIHLGSVLAQGSGWTMVPTINPLTGEIAIALSSATPISRGIGGSLVTIDFHALAGIAQAPSLLTPAVQLVSSLNLGGTVIATELEDAQGTFTLSQGQTNSFISILAATNNTAPVSAGFQLVAFPPEGKPVGLTEANSLAEPLTDQGSAVVSRPADGAGPVNDTPPATSVARDTGWLLQIASAPPVSAVGNTWQRFTEPLFQVLGRVAPNVGDVLAGNAIRDALERVIARPSPAEMVKGSDSADWDSGIRDLDWNSLATAPDANRTKTPSRDAGTDNEAAHPGPRQSSMDYAVVDYYFAQTSDDSEMLPVD